MTYLQTKAFIRAHWWILNEGNDSHSVEVVKDERDYILFIRVKSPFQYQLQPEFYTSKDEWKNCAQIF